VPKRREKEENSCPTLAVSSALQMHLEGGCGLHWLMEDRSEWSQQHVLTTPLRRTKSITRAVNGKVFILVYSFQCEFSVALLEMVNQNRGTAQRQSALAFHRISPSKLTLLPPTAMVFRVFLGDRSCVAAR
jgi:hypothetical protein